MIRMMQIRFMIQVGAVLYSFQVGVMFFLVGVIETNPDLSHDGPETSQIRRSGRTRLPPLRFEEEFPKTFMTLLQDDDEPATFKHAISCPASQKWMDAMVEELDSIKVNRVWELVDLPKGRREIGNKWVLKNQAQG